MNFSDYRASDATALAGLVAAGEVSAAELLDVALARHATVHGDINAVCRLMDGEARGQLRAALPAGAFSGVPFLIKDLSLIHI